MNNRELELLPHWRWVEIPRGEKGPRTRGWQNNPLTLRQVGDDKNIGVLLGEHSGGLVAIDFDGLSAFDWYEQHIGVIPQNTVAWSSGREGRCQMAFTVEPELWSYISTRKVSTGEREGFEFRWNGCQSVVPPSIHPTTGNPYQWLLSPLDTAVQPVPLELINWILQEPLPVTTEREWTPVDIADLTEDKFNDVDEVLRELHRHCRTLDYDVWFKVICCTANELGESVAEELLKQYWAEEYRGEYRKKIKSRNPNRSGGVGSLIHIVRQHNPNFRQAKPKHKFLPRYQKNT